MKRATIKIATAEDTREVKALIFKHVAVHQDGSGDFTLTHIPSGRMMHFYDEMDEALDAAELLESRHSGALERIASLPFAGTLTEGFEPEVRAELKAALGK